MTKLIGDAPESAIAKIDDFTTNGLTGVNNSLSYRVNEIERHNHGRECWRGKLAVQTATAWADETLSPFRSISGANAWGTDTDDEALVLGTDDTPFVVGRVKFDAHRILVIAVSVGTPWLFRLIWGSGTMADAITAEQYSCIMFQFDSVNPQLSAGIPVDVMMPRANSGVDKIWAQAWNATDNATVDFTIGTHEYEG